MAVHGERGAARILRAAYQPTWRLWHLYAIKVALDHHEEIRTSFASDRPGVDDNELSDSTLYGAVTSGLYAAALGETVMYAEDLFTLLYGLRGPESFVARSIEYPGGKVKQLVGMLDRLDDAGVARAFFVPTAKDLGLDGDEVARFNVAKSVLRERLGEQIRWWHRYRFMQQQYKHGGTLALRPFSPTLPEETIERRKRGDAPPVYVFDNADVNEASLDRARGVTSFVSSEVPRCSSTPENFSRSATSSGTPLTLPVPFGEILETATNCCELIQLAIGARLQLLRSRSSPYEISLPNENGTWMHVGATDFTAHLNDFSLKL